MNISPIFVHGNPFDLLIMVCAGLLGFLLRRQGFPMPPLVISMVLELIELKEQTLYRSGLFRRLTQHARLYRHGLAPRCTRRLRTIPPCVSKDDKDR